MATPILYKGMQYKGRYSAPVLKTIFTFLIYLIVNLINNIR